MNAGTLDLSSDEMRLLGHRVVEMLVQHFETLRDKPATRHIDRAEVRRHVSEEPPEHPVPVDALLRQLEEHVFANIGLTTHPRFFAFVPSPSNFVSVMADCLAAGFNVFAGNWLEAAAPSEIERITLEWLRQWVGLPQSYGGVLVSGGSVANLTALAAARQVKLIDSPFVVRHFGAANSHSEEGTEVPDYEQAWGRRIAAGVAYCSTQAHSSLDKAFRILGFGPGQLVKLPCDGQFRLRVDELRRRVAQDRAAGLRPFCVVANAGTTNTGAVDPLHELADFCRDEDLWLHADGAYGAAAALCEEGRRELAGLERVDSLSIDPHKWLFQPYECGCVLVRDWKALHRTFSITADYLEDALKAADDVSFQDVGIQLTRSFRALKVWMSLRTFGLPAFREAIRHGIRLAELAEQTARQEGFEITSPARLAIVTFRWSGGLSPEAADAVNEAIVQHTLDEGFATVTSTRINGRKVLRMCTINPRTTEDDIRATISRLRVTASAIATAAP